MSKMDVAECVVCGRSFRYEQVRKRRRICSKECRAKRANSNRRGKPTKRKVYLKRCVECGSAYKTTKKAGKFCSLSCATTSANRRHVPIIKTCEECGEGFTSDRNSKRFCSRRCVYRAATLDEQEKRQRAVQVRAKLCAKSKMKRLAACKCGVAYMKKHPHMANTCTRCKLMGDSVKWAKKLTCDGCGMFLEEPAVRSPRKLCEDCRSERYRDGRRDAKKRRRARKKGVHCEAVNSTKVFERDGWRCCFCGVGVKRYKAERNMDDEAQVDHIIPLSRGGSHAYSNVQTLCRKCNIEKGDKVLIHHPTGGPSDL